MAAAIRAAAVASSSISSLSSSYRYGYLHGFASHERSKKGVWLSNQWKINDSPMVLNQANLNNPSFAKLTYTGALQAMTNLDTSISPPSSTDTKWRLFGSSMGAYIATR
jgi:predicted esterase YcpF (UPF0227 family)